MARVLNVWYKSPKYHPSKIIYKFNIYDGSEYTFTLLHIKLWIYVDKL